jgi:hypothetical protein
LVFISFIQREKVCCWLLYKAKKKKKKKKKGNYMTLPQMFNVKRMICIDNTESKQDSKRMVTAQEATTTEKGAAAITVDTTLVVDYTTINRERENSMTRKHPFIGYQKTRKSNKD